VSCWLGAGEVVVGGGWVWVGVGAFCGTVLPRSCSTVRVFGSALGAVEVGT
jgi:hypothetical protein